MADHEEQGHGTHPHHRRRILAGATLCGTVVSCSGADDATDGRDGELTGADSADALARPVSAQMGRQVIPTAGGVVRGSITLRVPSATLLATVDELDAPPADPSPLSSAR